MIAFTVDMCTPPLQDHRQLVHVAARILRSWPSNLLLLLENSTSDFREAPLSKIQKHFGRLHRRLFGRRHPEELVQTEFVEAIIADYANSVWGYKHPEVWGRLEHRLPTGFCAKLRTRAVNRQLRNHGSFRGGIVIESDSVRARIAHCEERLRSDGAREYFTLREVAARLGCPAGVVSGLVRKGYLSCILSPHGYLFDVNPVIAFEREFIFVKVVAKDRGVTSREVLKICNRNHIQIFCARSDGGGERQSFIRLQRLGIIEFVLQMTRRAEPQGLPATS